MSFNKFLLFLRGLGDEDKTSRSKGLISVFYGNDSVDYQIIDNWELVMGEKGVLEVVLKKPILARYLKVQCFFDERDLDYNPVNKSTFTNVTRDLIKIYYIAQRSCKQR